MKTDEAKTIKVIVSHDVDHLFAKDHWFRDLSYPKMWARETIQLRKKDITAKEWWYRCISCFRKERHNLDALMDFDEKHGIPSTFFFGMNQGLGMSYKPEEAKQVIRKVHERGFAVGVHGIEYQNSEAMKKEYDTFKKTTGFMPCGIRMHYVRFDEKTFDKLNDIGYVFDTSEFDKSNQGTRKSPYQVGKMWEFPLSIMDGYLPNHLERMKETTVKLFKECEEKELDYVTVLFHDFYFCEEYQDLYQWYRWLMEWLMSNKSFSFTSYLQAIKELESR